MTEKAGDMQPNGVELTKFLGISSEMAAAFVSQGHVVFSEDKKLTFIRLRDIFQSLRKTAACRATGATS
ncbi:MAG: hypothetical protein FJ135_07870 [Deltaproteobacteria bacterium]|nr:hypothetical protein [Deltaproteobacteria bacterium]